MEKAARMTLQIVSIILISSVIIAVDGLSDGGCHVINNFRKPDCTRIRVINECSRTRPCPLGKTCCPGICDSRRCMRIKHIPPPPQCPPVPFYKPSDCAAVLVINECSVESQNCPPGMMCCPGYCGAKKCVRKPECPLVKCRVCRYGYVKDPKGCKTCRCKSGPTRQCPVVPLFPPPYCGSSLFVNECSLTIQSCPPGKVCCKRACGGTECIRIRPMCPKRICPSAPHRICPLGYRKDKYGCPTCECNTLCPRIRCPRVCPMGYKKDKSGCPTCACRTCPCGPKCCKLFCPWGYVTDAYGCELCKCKKCPPIKCSTRCPHGYIIDKNGCNTCRCREPICPLVYCRNACRFGYKRTRYGCQTCHCRSSRPSRLNFPSPSRRSSRPSQLNFPSASRKDDN